MWTSPLRIIVNTRAAGNAFIHGDTKSVVEQSQDHGSLIGQVESAESQYQRLVSVSGSGDLCHHCQLPSDPRHDGKLAQAWTRVLRNVDAVHFSVNQASFLHIPTCTSRLSQRYRRMHAAIRLSLQTMQL
jgi:hypothetical protein